MSRLTGRCERTCARSAARVPLLQFAHAANAMPLNLNRLLNIDVGGMCSTVLGVLASIDATGLSSQNSIFAAALTRRFSHCDQSLLEAREILIRPCLSRDEGEASAHEGSAILFGTSTIPSWTKRAGRVYTAPVGARSLIIFCTGCFSCSHIWKAVAAVICHAPFRQQVFDVT
jgi:hypothetical protein